MPDPNDLPPDFDFYPPATPDRIKQVEVVLGVRLPQDFRRFLLRSDGLNDREHGQIVFDSASLIEMNEAHRVTERTAGTINIGADGGGNALLLLPNGTVALCEYGALGSTDPTPIAGSFAEWIAAGLPIPREEDRKPDWTAPADVTLVSRPAGGLKDLMRLRSALSLDIGAAELKALAERLPAVLPASLTYGQAKRRCERVGDLAECLSIRQRGTEGPS
jgi:hypothetical protein